MSEASELAHDLPPAVLQTWRALAQRVAARSRHLGAAFVANAQPVLAADGGSERLQEWVDAALALLEREAWQAGVIVELCFANAPASVLATRAPAAWLDVALALNSAIDAQRFFVAVPAGLSQLTAAEQRAFLLQVATFARKDVQAALRIYRSLPTTLSVIDPACRQQLLALLASLPRDSDAKPLQLLAEVSQKLSETWRTLNAAKLESSLRALCKVVDVFPEAAVAALAVQQELQRHADIEHWIEVGLRIAPEHAAAAKAFFALESRESRAQLYAAGSGVMLEPELGVWRKLIEMAGAERAVIRRTQALSLRPSLESDPARGEVQLPAFVDWLPSREANRAVLRFLALQLAGRRQFGSYNDLFERQVRPQLSAAEPALEQLFLVAEAVRVQQRLSIAYPGCSADTQQLMQQLRAAWHDTAPRDFGQLCDLLLAAALAEPRQRRSQVALAELISLLDPVRDPNANVLHSLRVALELAARVSHAHSALDPPLTTASAERQISAQPAVATQQLFGTQSRGELRAAGSGASAGAGRPAYAADEPTPDTATQLDDSQSIPAHSRRSQQQAAHSFLYDEWDHSIGDYRAQHCRVHELLLTADSGVFFEQTVSEARSLLAHVRRQFEHMRPDRYRPLRNLEDGEDFDLNALTDARIEARVRPRRTPSSRIYTSRTRQARDVATLFLVDMSASTEQCHPESSQRRIIDTLKEALVVMTAALEKLGDLYAIYGFSSRGREQVEVYPVKSFGQVLDHNVKARIGGLEPKSGTRMGAALRHMIPKLTAVNARSKHLILLSDGFPQDHDYGVDRRTHTYGIEDTAVALREISAAGAVPFCITVDRLGHDYLRLMCDPSQYLIIDQLAELPRELPKIYRRIAHN